MTYESNPFSFHCMICFEEFHCEERYPVVLPCGHTYVCNVCANRLDKCMECRMPLYTVVRPNNNNKPPASGAPSVPPGASPNRASWSSSSRDRSSSSRDHHHNHGGAPPSPKAQPVVKKRLPLPKNVVLLSLIEATELATQDVQKKYSGSPQPKAPPSATTTTADTSANANANHPQMMPHPSAPSLSPTMTTTTKTTTTQTNSATGKTTTTTLEYRPPPVYAMNSMIDVEDEEEEKIRVGTSLAIGVAGTYAVAAREGMVIHPIRPPSVATAASQTENHHHHHHHTAPDEDVDSLFITMHTTNHINDNLVDSDENDDNDNDETDTEDKKSPTAVSGSDNKEKTSNKKGGQSPHRGGKHGSSVAAAAGGGEGDGGKAKLSFGDRVQVVALDGPWAKLARGYGYVRADRNHLVKVGGPVDQACKLEAMLRNLSHKRKELRMEQSRVDNQFVRIMNDLQLSLQKDEDLTVILADTFADSSRNFSDGVKEEHKVDGRSPSAGAGGVAAAARSPPAEERNDTADFQKPAKLDQNRLATTDAVQRRPQPSFGCFAGEVFAAYSADQSDMPKHQAGSANSTTTSPTASASMLNLFPTASHPSPSALRAGAQAWRERHGQVSQEGINFRTGMSGHMALLSTHTHAHEFLAEHGSSSAAAGAGAATGGTGNSTGMLKMSSHTGLSMSKTRFRGILSSLTLPSFGASGTSEGREDMVHPSGSM